MEIPEMLDRLADIKSQLQKLGDEHSVLVDAATPAEVRARLAEIDAEFLPKVKAASDNANEIEKQVKAAVLELGTTARGHSLMAMWSKGRVSWDTAALDGYLKAHPELESLRKQGEPSVSIREIKGG